MRGLVSRASVAAFLSFLFAPGAEAVVIEIDVRLRGLDRPLMVVSGEPGRTDLIVLEGDEFKIDTHDRDGTLHASREFEVGGQKKFEMISIFGEPSLLEIFKRSPQMGARMMGFLNANEVTCPPSSNFVLMYRKAGSRPQSMGNCVTLPGWPAMELTR